MKKITVASLLLFFVLLAAAPMLAVVPLFLFIWSQSKIQLDLTHFYRKYIVLGTFFGLVTEGLAILDNWGSPPEEKILFHPDPGVDLLLGLGFYFWIAVIWALLIKRYTFNVKSVFVIGGIWGIIAEQNMAVLLSPLLYGVFGFIMYIYVFLVYGSFMAIPVVFFRESLESAQRKEKTVIHVVLAFLMLFGAYALAGIYMGFVYTVGLS